MNGARRNASMCRADGNLMQIGDDIASGINAENRGFLIFVDHDASSAVAPDSEIADQSRVYFAAQCRVQDIKFPPLPSPGLSSNSVASQLEANRRLFDDDASPVKRLARMGLNCSICWQDRDI